MDPFAVVSLTVVHELVMADCPRPLLVVHAKEQDVAERWAWTGVMVAELEAIALVCSEVLLRWCSEAIDVRGIC